MSTEPRKMENSYVLITGASSGIGAGLAKAFAARGRSLILVARREERLQTLKKELSNEKVRVEIVPFDLFQINAAGKLFEICQEKGWEVDGLVNNAGLGWQKDLHELSEEQVDRMLTINLVVLTHLCRLFLPEMIKRERGFILNVASAAGFLSLPHFSVYAATKNFVVSLSEAIYEEVREKGVLVSCLCPGPTHTEFGEKAEMEPHLFALAQNVAKVIAIAMQTIETKRSLTETSVYYKMICRLMGILPRKWRCRLAGHVLKLKKQA